MPKMTPYRRAVAVTGSYTDRNGDEKKRYTNVGTLFQYEDGGFALKIDSIPVGGEWNGFVSFYEIEEKKDGGDHRREEPRRREPERGGGSYSQQSRGGGGQQRERPREAFPADLDDDSIPF